MTRQRLIAVAAVVTVAAALFSLGLLIFRAQHHPPRHAAARAGELSIGDVIAPSRRGTSVTTRGFYIDEGFGPRLCTGLTRSQPPACVGPYVELARFDESRVNLHRDRGATGRTVVWADDAVGVGGTIDGLQL